MFADQDTSLLPKRAIVAKTMRREAAREADRYLLITPAGAAAWVDDPATATPFSSMREATRMALRLPATLRAFGLPREPELAVHALH